MESTLRTRNNAVVDEGKMHKPPIKIHSAPLKKWHTFFGPSRTNLYLDLLGGGEGVGVGRELLFEHRPNKGTGSLLEGGFAWESESAMPVHQGVFRQLVHPHGHDLLCLGDQLVDSGGGRAKGRMGAKF